VDREPASHWYRFHVRQALAWGVAASVAGFLALLWPLLGALLVQNVVATIVIYVVAFVLDCALLGAWIVLSVRYAKQASRGTTFEIPALAAWNRRVSRKP